ncbi:MAG: hypothetical protein K0U76_17090 [Actinomycetia bacterium]|nr:hypothetical protein [Actinomycetes bacterium]MCH9703064.1 hypothetical protein [Actinomycetes bacterium]
MGESTATILAAADQLANADEQMVRGYLSDPAAQSSTVAPSVSIVCAAAAD